MKLFAKRKRKTEPSEAVLAPSEKAFQSDAVVEELLLQHHDPSTWNAKQRRMVKRYQERKSSQGNEIVSKDNAQAESNETVPTFLKPDPVLASDGETDVNPKDNEDKISSGGDGSKDRSASSSHSSSESQVPPEEMQIPAPTTKERNPDDGSRESHEIGSELQEQLNRLNSKQRRTLVRKFERDGDRTSLRSEVVKLLQPTKETIIIEEPPAKNKKRRKTNNNTKDWSTLPPDERNRREEQRRCQQEAAMTRAVAQGTSNQHKHPLNSERRRANRRKPKWERSKGAFHTITKQEHNSSGYHMRKVLKE